MDKVILKNEHLQVEISLHGAELKRIVSSDNTEYIWNSDPKYWNRSAPFLFPIVGTLKDKETYIDGELYKMGSHGFLRDNDFVVAYFDKTKVILRNFYDENTLTKYPFKYEALVTYTLTEKTLITNVEIINARLKTCGYRLVFKKVPKKLKSPVVRLRSDVVRRPICPVKRIRNDVVQRLK